MARFRMVGRIDDNDIGACLDQRRHPLVGIQACSDARPYPQLALPVLAGIRECLGLVNVLYRDHALQFEPAVDEQHFLDTVLVQELGDCIEAGVLGCGHETLLRRHHIPDLRIEALLEAHIAGGNDAGQLAAFHHRHAGDPVLLGQGEQFGNGAPRLDGDGVADDAGFVLLHRPHFPGLRLDGHVLVDDADAAFLGNRDSQPRLGDGIHRR